ncbi:hypothetical protein PV661_11940 [Streptomyces sp. MD20-1-1]|uniref:hypothetical protein n=1 Tax=Streptomyces sp. MD20-1-1 TaxID=3028668 RepID=UPI0029AB85E2|nr:hypothetical protein [Streptomyces sp. MD20-1-1]
MTPDINRTTLPPADMLPKPIQKLVAERDAAYEAASDFIDEHAVILGDGWEKVLEARDTVAAAEAAVAGKDPLKVPSELEAARAQRPRILGAAHALARRANAADAALVREWRKHVADMAPAARERLEKAAQAYEAAYRAYTEAREAFGAASYVCRYVRAAQGTGYIPDFNDVPQNPQRIDGRELLASPGLGEIREVLRSLDEAERRPVERIRRVAGRNGVVLELTESQARALVNSSSNDVRYVDED